MISRSARVSLPVGCCRGIKGHVRVLMRRLEAVGGILGRDRPRHAAVLFYGRVRLDFEGHRARLGSEDLQLTRTEFDPLHVMIQESRPGLQPLPAARGRVGAALRTWRSQRGQRSSSGDEQAARLGKRHRDSMGSAIDCDGNLDPAARDDRGHEVALLHVKYNETAT